MVAVHMYLSEMKRLMRQENKQRKARNQPELSMEEFSQQYNTKMVKFGYSINVIND